MVTQHAGEVSRSDAQVIGRRPFWARVSAGQAVMVLAALAAFVLNIHLIRSQEAVTLVAVAAQDIVPGVELRSSMLEFVEIDAENPVVERLITGEGLDAVLGKVVTNRVFAGEFVSAAVLSERATDSNLRAMTVPVDASHAGGGDLIARGDLVDIIAVSDGLARYVVTGVQVLEIPTSDTGGLVGATDYFIVIAVDADMALEVAEALQADSLEILLSTGAPTPERLTLPRAGAQPDTEEPNTGEGEGSGEEGG
jgi:Flp pilus assembly protein CpaB